MLNILGHNFIADSRCASGQKTHQSFNATTGEALPYKFWQATPAEVELACEQAALASKSFRTTSAEKRAELLDTIANEIDELGADFVELVCAETALPAARIQGEQKRTVNQLRLFAEVLRRGDFYGARIDTALPGRTPLPRPDLRQYKTGVGPVAVFGASNFPLAFSTAGGDTASALAAGCPVVFKAHSGHMATSECVALAIRRALTKVGLPAGVFSMIYGGGVGELLVKHPAIKAVGFTGSLKGGRALCDMAAARPEPIPVFAEMSSINPVIVLPKALELRGKQISEQLADSIVLGCGQFCTNPGLVIGLDSPEFGQFVASLSYQMGAKPSQTMLNAGTLSSYAEGVQRLNKSEAVSHLAGRQIGANQAEPQLFKAEERLLIDGDELLQEEVFGPASIVVSASGPEQLEQALQGLRGQLTASLIAEPEDLREFAHLIPLLETKVGRLLVNGFPTGVEVSDSMVHGGPYPATSDSRGTSVGTLAIDRFLRPVCYQNFPDEALPDVLKNSNPLGVQRLVNGVSTKDPIS
ncbi:aldehyde dehydrogenase (NADP(+)) [Pseudomonas sp. TCU-HL1]|uniref:aldehyde dehydrogenase (NADP(+)) n=1 Tax=Pseudomonas sp. TCU-HL1 TaxID=1856685 RepID=UPI00083DF79B|nr:aldehyde dehydrogenase (NADP(+)) [Pseudomonas sp. TCU-HL1]AOE85895.1 ketoglutarate semialdehyde dehydrogenase [Pseudomonas sp. TCU-HL1]